VFFLVRQVFRTAHHEVQKRKESAVSFYIAVHNLCFMAFNARRPFPFIIPIEAKLKVIYMCWNYSHRGIVSLNKNNLKKLAHERAQLLNTSLRFIFLNSTSSMSLHHKSMNTFLSTMSLPLKFHFIHTISTSLLSLVVLLKLRCLTFSIRTILLYRL
jgi:hypothetical protein